MPKTAKTVGTGLSKTELNRRMVEFAAESFSSHDDLQIFGEEIFDKLNEEEGRYVAKRKQIIRDRIRALAGMK